MVAGVGAEGEGWGGAKDRGTVRRTAVPGRQHNVGAAGRLGRASGACRLDNTIRIGSLSLHTNQLPYVPFGPTRTKSLNVRSTIPIDDACAVKSRQIVTYRAAQRRNAAEIS